MQARFSWRFPSCFRKVEYFVVASASYGIKPGIRMRMFFWSQHPVSNVDLKKTLVGYETIADPAIFNPIQPIYTAKPIFDGVNDPIAKRIEWIIPFGIFSSYVEIVPQSQHYAGAPEVYYTRKKAEAFIERKLIEIAELHMGERHDGLVSAGLFLGKLVGQGHFDRLETIERVMDACSYWTGRRDVKRDREVVTWAIDSGVDAMYKGEAV